MTGCNVHLFIRELKKKFSSGSMGSTVEVNAKNEQKYISFNINVTTIGEYEDMWGKTKEKKFSLDS